MSEIDAKTAIITPIPPQNPLVTVYLRLPSSHSVKLQLNPSIQLPDLHSKVTEFLKIPQSCQIIYHKGKQLRPGKQITISDRSIFHIKDRRDMLEQISIDIILHQPQPFNFFKVNPSFTTLKVSQQETVGDLLRRFLNNKQQNFDLKRSRIIQCGRFLKQDKTFRELNIQEKAQIHIILKEKMDCQGLTSEQQNEEHEKLVHRVLKHSRQNSLEMPEVEELALKAKEKDIEEVNESLQPESKILLQQSHICNFGEEEEEEQHGSIVVQNPSQIFGKSNPQMEKGLVKSRSSLFMSHTKSSEKWIREKVTRLQLTPLKLGLREYKKYEGPLSVRACNCKKRTLESQQHIKLDESQQTSTLSPCLGSKSSKSQSKSQNKLKKSFTLIN